MNRNGNPATFFLYVGNAGIFLKSCLILLKVE